MKTYKVSPKLAVATQPDLAEIATLAEQGYALLINNRPEGEDVTQPGSAAEEEVARAAGLDYLHLPVGGAPLGEADVRDFQAAIEGAKGPVLAHCRSGTRSLNIWAIGEVLDGRMKIEDLRPLGQNLGLDLRSAEAWLVQNG